MSSYQMLNESYGKDNDQVYYQMEPIPNSDPGTFELIGWFFSKDKNSVYFKDAKLSLADSTSFKHINWIYSKDKNHVYYKDKIILIPEVDVASFTVISFYKAKDRYRYYSIGKNGDIQARKKK